MIQCEAVPPENEGRRWGNQPSVMVSTNEADSFRTLCLQIAQAFLTKSSSASRMSISASNLVDVIVPITFFVAASTHQRLHTHNLIHTIPNAYRKDTWCRGSPDDEEEHCKNQEWKGREQMMGECLKAGTWSGAHIDAEWCP